MTDGNSETSIRSIKNLRGFDVIAMVLILANGGVLSWGATSQVSLSESVNETKLTVARLESKSFSSQDGLEVWREIYAIRQQLAELEVLTDVVNVAAKIQHVDKKLETLNATQNEVLRKLSLVEERVDVLRQGGR